MTTNDIIQAINKQRKLNNLKPVKPNNSIDIATTIQAKQMAKTGKCEHNLRNVRYPRPEDRIRASGYNCTDAGEILYAGEDNAETAIQLWMGSKPHRMAVLDPDVEEVGASIARANGESYACVVLCAPRSDNKAIKVGHEILNTIRKRGETAGKQLLVQIAQSERMRDIIKSPIIQRIIAALRR